MTDAERYPWHEDAWNRLMAAYAAGRLPHALLLSGPQGLGKAAFGRRLSNALVCTDVRQNGDACGLCSACRLSQAGSHPDQHLIVPEEAGKMIKIDAIRALTAKSVLAAQEGSFRVFLVMPAEAMNKASANALLKTLEEPVARAVLVLVSSFPHRLPATIRSRCQIIKFARPSADRVKEWLGDNVDPSEVDDLLAISGGAPLRALQAREEDWLGEGRRLGNELMALKIRKTNPLQVVEEWEKRPLPLLLEALKRCVSDLVRFAAGVGDGELYHGNMRQDLQSLGQGIDLQALYRFNDVLLDLERAAVNNLNVQMMLEYIANQWLQITRPGAR